MADSREWHDEVREWLAGKTVTQLEVREPELVGCNTYTVWALPAHRRAVWTCLQEFQGKELAVYMRNGLAWELGLPELQLDLFSTI